MLNQYMEKNLWPLLKRGTKLGSWKEGISVVRQVSFFKKNVEKALWFAESFGQGRGGEGDRWKGPKLWLGKTSSGKYMYDQLDEVNKLKIRKLLYILDSFGILDDAYHEFSLQHAGMVRSYLVKQCSEAINKTISISRTPGSSPGAQMNVLEMLDTLLDKLQETENDDTVPSAKIKLSADGQMCLVQTSSPAKRWTRGHVLRRSALFGHSWCIRKLCLT